MRKEREYRTYFQIGTSWGVNETTALRITRKVEDIFIKSGLFNLPGKKAVQPKNTEIEIVVVDVAEHEIERPKKSECVIPRYPRNERRAQDNKECIIVANKNVIH